MKVKANTTRTPRKKKGVKKNNRVEDRPLEDEVNVKIKILDIKYGDSRVNKPGVTTIYEGQKLDVSVPFSKGLGYSFEKVEQDMVFKYAVTSEGDLLGFLYLEIP
jgi:hypothetical protein